VEVSTGLVPAGQLRCGVGWGVLVASLSRSTGRAGGRLGWTVSTAEQEDRLNVVERKVTGEVGVLRWKLRFDCFSSHLEKRVRRHRSDEAVFYALMVNDRRHLEKQRLIVLLTYWLCVILYLFCSAL